MARTSSRRAKTGRKKTVSITAESLISDFGQVAAVALQAARAGAKTLVVRNTVSNAVATQEVLEQVVGNDRELLFAVNGVATLHHSRFALDDRRALDGEVEERSRPETGHTAAWWSWEPRPWSSRWT